MSTTENQTTRPQNADTRPTPRRSAVLVLLATAMCLLVSACSSTTARSSAATPAGSAHATSHRAGHSAAPQRAHSSTHSTAHHAHHGAKHRKHAKRHGKKHHQTARHTTKRTTTHAPTKASTGRKAVVTKPSPVKVATTPTRPSPAPSATHYGPCTSKAACVVSGDAGAVSTYNTARKANSRATVPGSTTSRAQQCAVQGGSGSSCASARAWVSVQSFSGTTAINSLMANAADRANLMDPNISSVEVGWAYHPEWSVPGYLFVISYTVGSSGGWG